MDIAEILKGIALVLKVFFGTEKPREYNQVDDRVIKADTNKRLLGAGIVLQHDPGTEHKD